MAGTNGVKANGRERTETKRVVLERARVLVLPEGVRIEELVAAKDERAIMKLLGRKIGSDPYAEAWLVAGEFGGVSKEKSIEAYAGKAGTPDAKVGAFRAVPVSAWKDGVEHVAPPKPLVEKKALA